MRALLLAIAVAGCAGADAMPLTAPQPTLSNGRELGLHPGENMTYDVQLAGVLVGEAQLAVGEIGEVDGKRALVVRSRAATAGAAALVKRISDESITVIDAETGRPLKVDMLAVNGDKKASAQVTFDGRIAKVTYKRSEEAREQILRFDARDTTLHDMHTAMAAIRGWRAAPGTVRTVHLIGGRRVWKIEMKYIGEETIGSKLGNRRAVVLEGTSFRARRDLSAEPGKPTRTFRVWLSDDADRVPIKCSAKTELGDIVMDLVDYQRP